MSETKRRLDGYMFLITLAAACAGLLFGFDAGVISGALLFIKHTFVMSTAEQGLMVSAVPFGALVSAALSGRACDYWGRKHILTVTAVLYVAGSIMCAFSGSVEWLVFGRLILGIAVGIGSFAAPMYISEVAHKKYRGALVTLNQFAIVVGICLSYLVDYMFAPSHSWRWMLGFAAFPGVILFFATLVLPQSPRWLVAKGKLDRARKVLKKLLKEKSAEKEIADIQGVVGCETRRVSFKTLLRMGFGRVLMLGILVSILTQAVGINAIIYYAPTIFKLTGFSGNSAAIMATLGVGFVNVVFTALAIFLLDIAGRRKLLLTGLVGIVVSLAVLVVAFSQHMSSGSLAWLALVAMMVFVACQAFSTGPACWLIPSEIFPTMLRGFGMGISVACNWGANVIVAFFFPIVLKVWGPDAAFAIFLAIAVVTYIYFFRNVPETKNVTLEQIEANLKAGKRMRDLGKVVGKRPLEINPHAMCAEDKYVLSRKAEGVAASVETTEKKTTADMD